MKRLAARTGRHIAVAYTLIVVVVCYWVLL